MVRGHGLARTMAVLAAFGCLAPAVPAERGAVVLDGIERHAGQVSTMWSSHAGAVGLALDGAVISETRIARETEETRAVRAHSPSAGVCEGVESLRGTAASRAHETTAAYAAGDALVQWLAGDTVHAPGSSAPADLRARVDEVLERYCAPGRMAGAGTTCRGARDDHAADLHPGAVLGVRTLADEESAIAGFDWARNIALPVLHRAPALRAARSAEGRRAVLALRGRNARAAISAWYLQGRVSARLPAIPATGRATMSGTEGGDAAEPEPSRHELLESLSRGRYERPGGVARHQGENRANLLREWIASEGTSLMLAFEQYRDAERQGAMLAARLSQVLLHREEPAPGHRRPATPNRSRGWRRM